MDHEIGRLVAALDDPAGLNLKDSTFVMFSSDNGPQPRDDYDGTANCYGVSGHLRGVKASLYEGGIRVPGIVRWPGHAPAGSATDAPVNFTDVMPTLCEIAGVAVPADRVIDGASLLPALRGRPVERPRPLFWANAGAYETPGGGWRKRDYNRPKVAMRVGDWKILGYWRRARGSGRVDQKYIDWVATERLTRFELYDLKNDPAETTDLKEKEPERFARMAETLSGLFAEIQAEGHKWGAAGP
jgi:arylsulfatase A